MNPMATSREEILKVIRELIRRQGWEAVNVRAVASACGVAVGTLYNYVPSRDALVAASVESVWKDIFHHGEGMEDFGDILSCVRWLYRRMEYGAQRYPNFFSLHALNFGEGEKAQGRRQMLKVWEHIRLRLSAVAAELGVVLPVSFYEKDGTRLFNSIAMIDADGTVMGVYRKTHIPDDHYYQEKFYFTPGNTGFRVWDTRYGKVGVGICWDQWFPEAARCMALMGADLLMYPTAIGSEPILEVDSAGHWQRTMQGHSAANVVPVVAANRFGTETVVPCPENGGQSSSLCFYGTSFMTDATGAVLTQAPREGDTILHAEYDFAAIREERLSWGLFRDRRPECYGEICDL